jgi:hypothetical protein
MGSAWLPIAVCRPESDWVSFCSETSRRNAARPSEVSELAENRPYRSWIPFLAQAPACLLPTLPQEADYRLFLIEPSPQFRYRWSPVEAGLRTTSGTLSR